MRFIVKFDFINNDACIKGSCFQRWGNKEGTERKRGDNITNRKAYIIESVCYDRLCNDEKSPILSALEYIPFHGNLLEIF